MGSNGPELPSNEPTIISSRLIQEPMPPGQELRHYLRNPEENNTFRDPALGLISARFDLKFYILQNGNLKLSNFGKDLVIIQSPRKISQILVSGDSSNFIFLKASLIDNSTKYVKIPIITNEYGSSVIDKSNAITLTDSLPGGMKILGDSDHYRFREHVTSDKKDNFTEIKIPGDIDPKGFVYKGKLYQVIELLGESGLIKSYSTRSGSDFLRFNIPTTSDVLPSVEQYTLKEPKFD